MAENIEIDKANKDFHKRLSFLIGTKDASVWAKSVGLPATTFHRIWKGKDIPKHEHLCRIAKHCNVSLDWLLLGKDDVFMQSDFSFLPLKYMANCGLAQGWYNEQDLLQSIILPKFLIEDDVFAILCKGHSMTPANIKDGNVCLAYPHRVPEIGKPVLIRTKSFTKGKEVSLATIKTFEGEESDRINISGWLDVDESGVQSKFLEQRMKNCITMIAPIGSVLPMKLNESEVCQRPILQESILTECLEALKPMYLELDSQKFSEIVIELYQRRLGKSSFDANDMAFIVSKVAENIGLLKKIKKDEKRY